MTPRSPQSDDEWNSYYDLRWRVLRAPWGQPPGGDPDEGSQKTVHAMIAGDGGRAIAVGRLLFKSAAEAQVRSMATEEAARGRGLGRRVMEYLEQAARAEGVTTIFLNAREDVVPFYAKLGYEVTGDGPTLFDCIRHKAMRKQL
jgi:predicted GNAT family N-acyltransferase